MFIIYTYNICVCSCLSNNANVALCIRVIFMKMFKCSAYHIQSNWLMRLDIAF